MRTFLSVFPNATLWGDGSLMIASKQPLRLRREDFERKIADPGTRAIFESMGYGSFEAVLKQYVAGPEELRRFVGEGPILTDNRPLTEYFFMLPRRDRPIDFTGLTGDVRTVLDEP
jgi:hypothetical protein